ncbi:MAG: ATP-binding protein [Gammaproteobacteria bacterium]
MSQGKDSSRSATTLGIALLLAMPFLLLAWLLAGSIQAHIERFRQMDAVITGFLSALEVIAPLETVRDLSAVHLLLDTPEINTVYNAAKQDVDRRLPAFMQSLRAHQRPILDAHAERVDTAWRELRTDGSASNPVMPFDNIERVNDEIYAALASLFFVTDMAVGEDVSANELLLMVLDTRRKARRELGLMRAIAVYTMRRDGYFGSAEAEHLDIAWGNLRALMGSIDTQRASVAARLATPVQPTDLRGRPVMRYLEHIEQAMLLSLNVDGEWEQEWSQGQEALSILQDEAYGLVSAADAMVRSARSRQLAQDAAYTIGLLLLYALLTALAISLYRSRDAAVRAQADSRAKSLFLARMSHEIRTPLNGVIGLAELVADTELTPRQREYIDLIRKSGQSLAALVNDILDLARVEAGKLALEAKPVDIRGVAGESVRVLSLAAGNNRTLVFCHVADDVPACILGDAARLRQVLLNLVSNAVKFTKDGRVELVITRARNEAGAPALRIEVRDTGIGLSEAEQENLFTLFTQASAEVGHRYGGSGLGLSISRELVQLMGGRIGVHSAPGAGATFWCELPLANDDNDGQPLPRGAQLRDPALLVDLDGHMAGAVARLGPDRTRGLQVAREGAAAAALLDGHPGIRSVVICAQQNPQAGRAVADELHRQRPLLCIRLLMAVSAPAAVGAENPDDRIQVVDRSVFTDDDLIELLQCTDAPATGANDDVVPAAQPSAGGLRVLVAEDNPVNRMVIDGLLQQLAITAELVADGRQAVTRYRMQEGRYDVLLMDLDMPVLDGNGAAREIRRLEQAAGWPRRRILALSAHASAEHGEQARLAGMDGQVVKPVTLDTLRHVLLATGSPAARSSYDI